MAHKLLSEQSQRMQLKHVQSIMCSPPLERGGLPGVALDQLGVPRGVTITVPWQLSGEPLCMGRLRGKRWGTEGNWVGNTYTLLTALAEAARYLGADPDNLRFWMRYNSAAAEATADGSSSEAEPPAVQDPADPFPQYSGAAGSVDVGVLSGHRLVPVTLEEVHRCPAESPIALKL